MANFAGPAIADQLGRQHRAADGAAQMNVVLSEPADVERGVVGKPMPGGVAKAAHLIPAFLDQIPTIDDNDCFAGFAPELEQAETATHWFEAGGF